MVLSKNAVEQGAECHLIPDTLPGIGFVTMEGVTEPVRVRFPYVSDECIAEMVQTWPALANRPVQDHDDAVQDAKVIDLRDARTTEDVHQDTADVTEVIPAQRDAR